MSQGVTFPREARASQLQNSTPQSLATSLRTVVEMKNPDIGWAEELATAVREAAETLSLKIQISIHSPRLPEMIEELEEVQSSLEAFAKFKESRLLIKPDEVPVAKAKSGSELLMLASFGSMPIPEPQPLPLPAVDPDIGTGLTPVISEGLIDDTWRSRTPKRVSKDSIVTVTQMDNLQQIEWMQKAEELRVENETLRRELAGYKRTLQSPSVKSPVSSDSSLPPNRSSTEEETTRVLRRSPIENAFVTISPNRYVDLLGFDSPMRSTINLGRSGSFDVPLTPGRSSKRDPEVVNDPWFLESCLWASGILFKSDDIEVLSKLEIERQRGTVKLCFRNSSPDSLLNLCITVISKEVVVREQMQEPPPSILTPSSQYILTLEVRPQRPYLTPPVLSVSYMRVSTKVEIGLKLPLPLSKFVYPVGSEYSDVEVHMNESRGCEKSAKYCGLKSGINNMKTLAKVFCLNNAFSLYFPNETGINRAIIGCGVSFGLTVLTQVQLNETATELSLIVWSSDSTLREELHRLLAAHIAKQRD